MDFSSDLFEVILSDLWPIFMTYILPISIWMLIPAIILRLIFQSQLSFQLGALIGLTLCFVIGPF